MNNVRRDQRLRESIVNKCRETNIVKYINENFDDSFEQDETNYVDIFNSHDMDSMISQYNYKVLADFIDNTVIYKINPSTDLGYLTYQTYIGDTVDPNNKGFNAPLNAPLRFKLDKIITGDGWVPSLLLDLTKTGKTPEHNYPFGCVQPDGYIDNKFTPGYNHWPRYDFYKTHDYNNETSLWLARYIINWVHNMIKYKNQLKDGTGDNTKEQFTKGVLEVGFTPEFLELVEKRYDDLIK